jgi:phage terminase Nu1 subunit (DNA packaging protein)
MGLFDTAAVGIGMTAITCCSCGVRFDVPTEWYTARRNDHEWFYCPNGHRQHYTGKSEAERLRDELAREKHRAEQAQARVEDLRRQRDHANARVSAHKGVVTKLRKRVALGSCPCCHRKFKDLRDHMRAEHPDWNPEKGAEAIAAKAK